MHSEPLPENAPAPEAQEQVVDTENASTALAVAGQAPWWAVSVLLHVLVILLAGLLSMSIELPKSEEFVVVNDVQPRKDLQLADTRKDPQFEKALQGKVDANGVDEANAKDPMEAIVPDWVLEKALIGDEWQTNNPDMPDEKSASGNPDARVFYLERGSDDKAGGGGNNGVSLADDTIGIGSAGSAGIGSNWGNGRGDGIGPGEGSGMGSLGTRRGGREWVIKRGKMTRKEGGGIANAIRWLAYHQEPDGHWDARKYGASQKTDTAMTGLALLAFLGDGQSERVGEYKDNVRRAVAWLKSKQDAQGLVYDTTDAGNHRGIGYPHAIAALALAEAAAMGNIPETRKAAQLAINYATEIHQVGEGSDKGGWRYKAKQDADTSVSGWFVMALKSAKVAGLSVDMNAFGGALKYFDSVEHKFDFNGYQASQYWYTVKDEHSHTAHRLTAIGALARLFCGWKPDEVQPTIEWFVSKGGVPSYGANGESVDLYYWYYASMAVYQGCSNTAKDGLWKQWSKGLQTLPDYQCKEGDDAGSWNPAGDYSSEWGRVGQTALSALCLEVYYRYALLR